jgi:hypothetical protein
MIGQGVQATGPKIIVVGAIAGVSAQELPGQPRQAGIDGHHPVPGVSRRGPRGAEGGDKGLCHALIERGMRRLGIFTAAWRPNPFEKSTAPGWSAQK